MTAPGLVVEDIGFHERNLRLRTPFRFGIVTLTEATQVFVRVRVRLSDGSTVEGQSAELLAAKWFDKNPDLSNEDNYDQLRAALSIARTAAVDAGEPLSAFGLHAAIAEAAYPECAARGLNGLIAGFGVALVDRAVLDALCRAQGLSVFAAVQRNLPGIDARTTPDLAGFDMSGFLQTLAPAQSIAVRHTVGLVDPITEAEIAPADRLNDGLPESLEAAVATYGLRHFKLKVGGDMAADIDRLTRIAAVLDRAEAPYLVSLDGNEQYEDAEAVLELLHRLGQEPALARLMRSTAYLEQPISRAHALERPVTALAAHLPVIIDESDSGIGVFPEARALGYAGISSKSCKGVYRALLNRARVAKWTAEDGAKMFMTAEDLTTQPGVALAQDLALATLIGCTHVERNGHHYVDGMAGAPEAEQQRFLAAHPDLYRQDGGRVRVAISDGRMAIGSLAAPALGTAVTPDWDSMGAAG
ncbi:enolase C-terminal domain-like protein [Frigidibacter sp. ROC022]|uniref:enolase C-terminal domain-like protein n=1 Tax=Frigidibacter sp. ROC022 TaxID=2971796 RepID=UPI00215A82E8|nr:enolase C-terminal domain-like protein [Frigidibacter sp. ROC022]MCR8723177.1 mandelate racemase [Frigidibacter sp. ROC022]